METQNFTQNEHFINRMIDIVRDHIDPLLQTDDEAFAGSSLWRTLTPREFYEGVVEDYQENAEAEIRVLIHKALTEKKLDRVFFLILVLVRMPPYILKDSERLPWGLQ